MSFPTDITIITSGWPTDTPATLGATKVVGRAGRDIDVEVLSTAGSGVVTLAGWRWLSATTGVWSDCGDITITAAEAAAKGGKTTAKFTPGQENFASFCLVQTTAGATYGTPNGRLHSGNFRR